MNGPRTYIAFSILEGDINNVSHHLVAKLPSIKFRVKDNDFFIPVPDGCQGFSLKQLKHTIAEVATAELCMGDVYDDGDVVFYDLTY